MSTRAIIANKQLVFSSKIENLGLIENLIDELCAQHAIGEDLYGNIIISLTEAVNNAIKHGNANNPSLNTQVTCSLLNERIVFTVSDEGKGFNHLDLPDPTAPENRNKITGRGVFLMQQLAEEVNFNASGNQVELCFNFAAN
ncbi:MAG: serine/threonine-protein kinase RsbW [Flavobacteriales bacterium]|jgi:serine/threonine-protein kinase RsbW